MTTTTEPPSGSQSLDRPETAKASWLRAVMQFEITKGKIKRKELMHFSRQLAVFVKAGIPLLVALDGITEELGDKKFKAILLDMRSQLEAGSTLADATASHPEAFPEFYIGMLRTAELSGTLDSTLAQLSDYIERDLDARRQVTSALTYPAIIAVVAVVVILILVGFVLPRFKKFFSDLNAKLPLPTRMLLAFTDFTQHYWWIFALLVAAIISAFIWMQRAAKGRELRDRFLLRAPAIGDLVQHILLERFCRIMGSMMSAGVPLPEALRVTRDATPNTVFQEGLDTARDAMMRGEGLAAPLARTGLFPAAARQMMRVGEDTGTLDAQLDTAAGFFARELDYKIKRFTSLFEPAVIIVMGGLVGFVAIALVSAMYGIFHQVHT
jgi:type IV pilus assembly protein PilC